MKIGCVRKIVVSGIFQEITLEKRKLFIQGQREDNYCRKKKQIKISVECELVIKGQECMYGTMKSLSNMCDNLSIYYL
jgi:hypothetical protein